MWADAGLSGFETLTSFNPMRWSSQLPLADFLRELKAMNTSRPLRIYMTSEEERITTEFTSVPDAIQWLESSFDLDAAPPADTAVQRWSLFGSCMRPTAVEEEETEVNFQQDDVSVPTETEPDRVPPVTTPSSGRGILEEDARVQYMWADARVLPLKMMQELSRHNPVRWSKFKSPGELADELDALDSMRPVLLSVQRKSGHLERHFHSARAAAQWLRRSSDSSNEVQHWDEERLCVICLTQPRNVMLMPCRHAVLCEDCLEILMERNPSACPVCRKRIQNHARGHFVDDYVELVRALEMRMERSQMAAYEGMYNHIRPLMVTGALLASGAAACFVICPPAAPALLAGAGVVGYLPWFATTVANFEQESTEERTHQIFTPEDYAHPLALVGKGVILLVAAPVALTVFFIPYGLYAGVLRPFSRLVAQGLLRGACATHVYLLRPVANLVVKACQLMLDGTVAAGNFLGDLLGVTAQAFYDAVLAPTWSGLKWLGGHIATVAQHLGHAVAWAAERSWNVMRSWGAWAWQGMEYVGRNAYHKVLAPAGQILSTLAEGLYAWVLVPMGQLAVGTLKGLCKGILAVSSGLWNYVLVPSASVTWQGLNMLGNGLSMAAEHAYGYVLQPLAGGLYSYIFLPIGWAVSKVATGTAYAFGAAAMAVATLAEGCFNYVLRPCFNAVSYVLSGLISVVSTVASGSYNYFLLPVAGAAASAGKAIYTYVLVPCGTATMACGRFLVQVFTVAGETVYLYVLCPLGRGGHATVEALWRGFAQSSEVVRVTFQGLVRA